MIRRLFTASAAALAVVTFAALLAPPGCNIGDDCVGDCCAGWGPSCDNECLPDQETCAPRPVGGPLPGRCGCLPKGPLGGDAGTVVVVVDDAGTEIDDAGAEDAGAAENEGGVP